jgi:hypothetical protein
MLIIWFHTDFFVCLLQNKNSIRVGGYEKLDFYSTSLWSIAWERHHIVTETTDFK